MKLRYINIWSSWKNKVCDEQQRDAFCYMMRSISNYLSRAVRKYHITMDPQIRMISMDVGMLQDGTRLLADNVLSINLCIDDSGMESFFYAGNDKTRYEYGLALLERGYRLAALEYDLPVEILLSIHEDFRKCNYLNEWKYPGLGTTDERYRVSFKGRLSLYEFVLIMDCCDRETKQRYSVSVLRLAPDEIYFQHLFKTAYIVNGKLIIDDFFGNRLLSVDLGNIQNKEPSVTLLSERIAQTDGILDRIISICSKTSPVPAVHRAD